MKTYKLLFGLALTLIGQSLYPATNLPTKQSASNEQYLEAMLMLPILKQETTNALVRYNNKTVSMFCNISFLPTFGKGMLGSLFVAGLTTISIMLINDTYGYNSSSAVEHRGNKCIAVTAGCVLLGLVGAYTFYSILKDMVLKLKARSSTTPLLEFSPKGITVWGKELAAWNEVGTIEAFEQVEGLNGVVEPVPTLCIYNTNHQCIMVIPQQLFPLSAAQIIELGNTYKSIYQAAH
jgi:hypothetical protein